MEETLKAARGIHRLIFGVIAVMLVFATSEDRVEPFERALAEMNALSRLVSKGRAIDYASSSIDVEKYFAWEFGRLLARMGHSFGGYADPSSAVFQISGTPPWRWVPDAEDYQDRALSQLHALIKKSEMEPDLEVLLPEQNSFNSVLKQVWFDLEHPLKVESASLAFEHESFYVRISLRGKGGNVATAEGAASSEWIAGFPRMGNGDLSMVEWWRSTPEGEVVAPSRTVVLVPETQRFWEDVAHRSPIQAIGWLEQEIPKHESGIRVLGVDFPAGLAVTAGPLAAACLLVMLLAHISRARDISDPDQLLESFPWVALYPDAIGKLITVATVAVLPGGVALALGIRYFDGWSSAPVSALLLSLLLVALGATACRRITELKTRSSA